MGSSFVVAPLFSHLAEEVKFNQTEQSSKDLLPFLYARARNSGVISVVSERDAIHEGTDITREILDEVKGFEEAQVLSPRQLSDRVFIVHGHDDQAVDQAELLIRRFGLTPIILRSAPSSYRTVIEKPEAYSDVGFAVVLLTPDDIGGGRGRHGSNCLLVPARMSYGNGAISSAA